MAATAEYIIRDQDRMRRARRYFEWQYRLAKAQLGQRVLEVGCGLGNFTERLLQDRQFVIAVDVEPACIAAHRARFSARPNVVSHCLDMLSPDLLGLRADRPDSVACLNVLEHIEDDRGALTRIHDVLPPGGRAVLLVPAFQSLYGPIDQHLGHYRRYSKSSFQNLAKRAGFQIRDLRYMNALGFFGWWFNAHVSGRTAQSETQIAVFDALVVPVLSRLESLKAPPVGQSLFAVLERSI